MVESTIERIRAVLRNKQGVTPSGLAKKAELHPNTLYGYDDVAWNPSAKTLLAIEKLLPDLEALPDKPAEQPREAA